MYVIKRFCDTKYTLREASVLLNVPYKTVLRWNNNRLLPVDVAVKISDKLGVSVKKLYNVTDVTQCSTNNWAILPCVLVANATDVPIDEVVRWSKRKFKRVYKTVVNNG